MRSITLPKSHVWINHKRSMQVCLRNRLQLWCKPTTQPCIRARISLYLSSRKCANKRRRRSGGLTGIRVMSAAAVDERRNSALATPSHVINTEPLRLRQVGTNAHGTGAFKIRARVGRTLRGNEGGFQNKSEQAAQSLHPGNVKLD